MRLKMLCSMVGPNTNLNRNDEEDFPDEEAKRLIEAGFAIPVAKKKTEKAISKKVAQRETRKK